METSLSRELSECLRMLAQMEGSLKRALQAEEHSHVGQACHDPAKAIQACEQLELFLSKLSTEDGRANRNQCPQLLQRVVDLNKQMDAIPEMTVDGKMECGICRALRFTAEGVRITMPALLRWSHGSIAGTAEQTLAIVLDRFLGCLDRLSIAANITINTQ